MLDDPEKGLFYARWNPLAKENVPDDVEQKDAYLKRISGYLADIDEEQKDNYWNLLAHSIIAAFLEYWISKINQAKANDYFLGKLLEERHFSKEEKDILLSYYIQMPRSYAQKAIENLEDDLIDKDNYLPIGSWAGVPEQWIGHDACFAAITDWMIDNYMTRGQVFDSPARIDNGTGQRPQRAITEYRVLSSAGGHLSWVLFSPKTGRTHQLRVHSALSLHAPIVGDDLYGVDKKLDGALRSLLVTNNLFLLAYRLTFQHPGTGKNMTVRAPIPDFMQPVIKFLEFKLP